MKNQGHDNNKDSLKEEAVEDACRDMSMNEIEDTILEDIPEFPLVAIDNSNTKYRSRSGRDVKR